MLLHDRDALFGGSRREYVRPARILEAAKYIQEFSFLFRLGEICQLGQIGKRRMRMILRDRNGSMKVYIGFLDRLTMPRGHSRRRARMSIQLATP